MMGKNGYFQLEIRNDATYLKLFTPEDGGNPISVNEVTGYLKEHGFLQFDVKKINDAVIRSKEKVMEVPVGAPVAFFVNESMSMEISQDKMQLICRMYPPSNNGGMISEQEIRKDLAFKRVKYGIDEKEIREFLTNREYCRDYIFARGVQAVPGKSASIEYFFNTNPDLRPKKNEDGSVNYRELEMISHVTAGDKLAHLTPAVEGKNGCNIFGEVVNPPMIKIMKFEYGKNISLSEDKLDLIAQVNGHVMLVNGKVLVSDVYEVQGNVDNSTGNIEYNGNVHVAGNVKGGFSVKAKGDIIIDGVIEDALISAEGQIVAKGGIHGMMKGVLLAEGNIVCKFIENATVKSINGYVETDSIIHSNVEAKEEIKVSGKNGFITGGNVQSLKGIQAKIIGSEMGAKTFVKAGMKQRILEEIKQTDERVKQINEQLDKMKTVIYTFQKKLKSGIKLNEKEIKTLQILAEQYKNQEQELEKIVKHKAELEQAAKEDSGASVRVTGNAFPGVSICIDGAELFLKDKKTFCRFVMEDGEIKMQAL